MTGQILGPVPAAVGDHSYRRYCRRCRATTEPLRAAGRNRCAACNHLFIGAARTGEVCNDMVADTVVFRVVEYFDPPGRMFIRAMTYTAERALIRERDLRVHADRIWRNLDTRLDDAYLPECDEPTCGRVGRYQFKVIAAVRVYGRVFRPGARVDLCSHHGSLVARGGVEPVDRVGRLVPIDPYFDEVDAA